MHSAGSAAYERPLWSSSIPARTCASHCVHAESVYSGLRHSRHIVTVLGVRPSWTVISIWDGWISCHRCCAPMSRNHQVQQSPCSFVDHAKLGPPTIDFRRPKRHSWCQYGVPTVRLTANSEFGTPDRGSTSVEAWKSRCLSTHDTEHVVHMVGPDVSRNPPLRPDSCKIRSQRRLPVAG